MMQAVVLFWISPRRETRPDGDQTRGGWINLSLQVISYTFLIKSLTLPRPREGEDPSYTGGAVKDIPV